MTTKFEKLMQSFNVNLEDLKFDQTLPLKKEWIPKILETAISMCRIKPSTYVNNIIERKIILTFDNENESEIFMNRFFNLVQRAINTFLNEIGENPTKYNRVIVIETNSEKNRVFIGY